MSERITRQNRESKKLLVVRKATPEIYDAFPDYCVMEISSAMWGSRFESAVIAFVPTPIEMEAINNHVRQLIPPDVEPVFLEKSLPETLSIPLNQIAWTPCGPDDNPTAKLIATLVIGGVPHHLEAYQVEWREVKLTIGAGKEPQKMLEQSAVGPDFSNLATEFSDLDTVFYGDGPFQTVEIDGRTYCLFLSPFRT